MTGRPRGSRGAGRHHEAGSAVVWLLLVVPALFAFAGLVLDGGRVITARQEAANLAEQAARSAVDQVDRPTFRDSASATIAPSGPAVRSAACGYVAAAARGASCTAGGGPGGSVQVTVTLTTRTAVLAAVGISQLTVQGSGTARPAVGATEEVPDDR